MEYKKIEIDLGRVEYFASIGLNLGEIAGALGISRATLDRRREVDAEIDERISMGRGKGVAQVAEALVKNALGGDTSAQKIFLNSVGGWAKKTQTTLDVTPTSGIQIVFANTAGQSA